jgi:hypothetical protein
VHALYPTTEQILWLFMAPAAFVALCVAYAAIRGIWMMWLDLRIARPLRRPPQTWSSRRSR